MINRILVLSFLFVAILLIGIAFAQGELPPAEIPATIATILGVAAPLIVQFLNQRIDSANTRAFLAIVLSAGIGLLGAVIQGVPISLSPLYVAWVFTVSQSAFNLFWKPLFNQTGLLKHPESK